MQTDSTIKKQLSGLHIQHAGERIKMKLHKDKNAVRVLLEQIHEQTGYRTDVMEKIITLC